MDFTNRGSSPVATPPVSNNGPTTFVNNSNASKPKRSGRGRSNSGLYKWSAYVGGLVVVALIAAVLLALIFGNPKSQSDYVIKNKLQAVFLNTGQVYFGNIQDINPQYLVLTHIFYLQTNSNSSSSNSSSSSNVSLVKLGCELHAPYDQMVINMQQVTFWENLQAKGQVAQAVAKYTQQYPNGQACSSTNSSSSVQTTPAKP